MSASSFDHLVSDWIGPWRQTRSSSSEQRPSIKKPASAFAAERTGREVGNLTKLSGAYPNEEVAAKPKHPSTRLHFDPIQHGYEWEAFGPFPHTLSSRPYRSGAEESAVVLPFSCSTGSESRI